MKTLRCTIVDDEPIARDILKMYIGQTPHLELGAVCKDAFEAMEVLQQEQTDILFLDINLPKLSGLSLLKTMSVKPAVVLTTAYSEYAIEGFELAVSDYLLKPFSLERFLQAVLKIRGSQALPEREAPLPSPLPPAPAALFVKSDKKLVKVQLASIDHVEAYGNYIKIYAETKLITPQTLSEFLEKLPAADFLRIHKSYVINFQRLKMIEGNTVVLESGVQLPIGKSYRKQVLERVESCSNGFFSKG